MVGSNEQPKEKQLEKALHAGARRSILTGLNFQKRRRFNERVRAMLEEWGTFTYYPEEDRFEEVVSMQSGQFSPTGKPRIMPGLSVYGREVYEATDRQWNLFLRWHPAAVLDLSSEYNPPSEGGLFDVDAFAVHREGNVG